MGWLNEGHHDARGAHRRGGENLPQVTPCRQRHGRGLAPGTGWFLWWFFRSAGEALEGLEKRSGEPFVGDSPRPVLGEKIYEL